VSRGRVGRAALLALLASVAPARGNGRFPASSSLDFQPGRPDHIAVGVTFGLLVSRDGGATWRWDCEAAIGFEGTYDPIYLWSPSGALFASTFNGLKVARDPCGWQAVPGPVGAADVTALAIGGDGAIWAAVSDLASGTALYRSDDDGRRFTASALPGQVGDVWHSIAVAPDDPRRIYVTGRRMMAGAPTRVLYRSTDGGASWVEMPTDALVGAAASELFLAAIDPRAPDHVYALVTDVGPGLRTALYRTTDAGAALPAGPTWTRVLEVPTRITGVVVRTTGEVLAITPAMGLYRSADGGASFALVPGVTLDGRCLRERADGTLWMCTNNLPPDRATLHVATEPTTWSPRLAFAGLTGPTRCPGGTVQRDTCEATLWCGLRDNLAIVADDTGCVPPPDAGPDAPGATGGAGGCCGVGDRPGGELALVVLGLARRRRQRARVAR
jgi:hypothetical protein